LIEKAISASNKFGSTREEEENMAQKAMWVKMIY